MDLVNIQGKKRKEMKQLKIKINNKISFFKN